MLVSTSYIFVAVNGSQAINKKKTKSEGKFVQITIIEDQQTDRKSNESQIAKK